MHTSFGFLVFGAALSAIVVVLGAREFYQRGFEAGRQAADVALSLDDLRTIHWLANNGFQRLLLIGAKRETGGFQERADAKAAHYALDRLESHLPKAEVSDTSFNRIDKLRMRWPDGPRTPPQDLVWNEWLNKEP
jgi:hypothetical protein